MVGATSTVSSTTSQIESCFSCPPLTQIGTGKRRSVTHSYSSYSCITPSCRGNRVPAAVSVFCQEWSCHGLLFFLGPRHITVLAFLPEPVFPSQAPSREFSNNLMISGCCFVVYFCYVNSSTLCCKQEILWGRIGATANLYCLGCKVISALLTPHTLF